MYIHVRPGPLSSIAVCCDNHTLNSGYICHTPMIHWTHLLGVVLMVGGVPLRGSPSPHLWPLGCKMCQFRTLVYWLGQLPWAWEEMKWRSWGGKEEGRKERGRKEGREGGGRRGRRKREEGLRKGRRKGGGQMESQRVKLKPKNLLVINLNKSA